MRRTPILLTALCLTLGASAAFAGTAPKVQPAKTQPVKIQTTTPATKAAPAKMTTKAGHHRHHRHQVKSPVPKKG